MPPMEEITPDKKPASPAMEYGELTEVEKRKMEIVEAQFQNPKYVEIEAPGVDGKKLKIQYIVLDARDENDLEHAREINDRTIIHVPGYGSSYRSPEKFVELLAVRGNKRVIVVSEPGHGGSDMSPTEWRKWKHEERSFAPLAEVLNRAIDAIRKEEHAAGDELTTESLSVTSSSKGSFVAEQFAVAHPEKVADAVFFSPAGVEHEPALSFHLFEEGADGKKHFKPHFGGLGSRYIPETSESKIETLGRKPVPDKLLKEFKGAYRETLERSLQTLEQQRSDAKIDPEQIIKGINYIRQQMAELEKFDLQTVEQQETDMYQGVTKNIMKDSQLNTWRGKHTKYGVEGLIWRVWEAFVLAKGGFLELLPKVKANTYVSFGTADKLFPASQMERVKKLLPQGVNVRTHISNMRHDEIYQRPRYHVDEVLSFIGEMRQKEKRDRQVEKPETAA